MGRIAAARELPNAGWRKAVLPLVTATLLAVPYVFFTTFNGMPWFDDEGTLLVGFRLLLDGQRMYDDIFSLYGPLYNVVYGLIYGVLRVPLTHAAGRAIAALMWLGYTAGFAGLCHRLTGSRTATLFTYVLVLTWLRPLMDSPGHPEEMCLLLLAVVLLIACSVERSRHVATLAGMGAAVAGLTLTKVNIGVFVGGSMALTLLSVTARGMWTRLATRVVTAALLLLPLIVEVSLFDFWWVKLYILFAVPVIGAALLTQPIMPRRDMLQPADWLIIAAGGSLVCITGIGGMMLAGSSGNAILYAILLQDAQFLCSWYIPLDVGRTGVLVALISLLAALAYVIARSRQRRIAFPIAILKFGFVLTALASFGSPQWAYLLLVPFCWLFSVQPAGLPQPYAVARWMASLIGGVMSLYPFPVAGHQVTIGTLLPIMMVPVLTCDVIQTVQQRTVDARLPDAWRIGALSLIVVLAIGVAATLASARAYLRGVPLDLPGTNLIRVAQERENDLQWVTAQLRTCASSYSVPGLWSFAFWTGHVPPSGLANNDVLGLIQPAQQGEIVAVLSRLPDLCVVYNPSYLERFDRGQIAADPPLLHYIQADFSIAAERNGFFIMKRRDSPP